MPGKIPRLRLNFGNTYSRIINPTEDVPEKRMAVLEDGVAALALANLQMLSKIASEYRLPLVADCTFTTPYLYTPLP